MQPPTKNDMKNFQQNLSVSLSLALCGLCIFQWHAQTVQRHEITALNGAVYQKSIALRDATNSIAKLNAQVEEIDLHLSKVQASAATNEELVAAQKAQITLLKFTSSGLTNEVTQYKSAVDTLDARLKEAYSTLQKQNDAITNLVAQRDAVVKKYNDEVIDRNNIVGKYNELAKRLQNGSNAPPDK